MQCLCAFDKQQQQLGQPMQSSPPALRVCSSTAPDLQSRLPSTGGTLAPLSTMGAGMEAPSRHRWLLSGASMRPWLLTNSIMPAPGMMLRPATTWSHRKARPGTFRSAENLHAASGVLCRASPSQASCAMPAGCLIG